MVAVTPPPLDRYCRILTVTTPYPLSTVDILAFLRTDEELESFRPRRHRRGTPRACIFHGGSGCDSDCGSGGGLVMATAATNLRDGKMQPCCAEVLQTIPQARIWRVDVEVGV